MNLLFLVLLFPLVGFFILALSRGRYSENLTAIIGVGSIGLSTLTAIWVALDFIKEGRNAKEVFTQTLWHWIKSGDFQVPIAISLDKLSLVMLFVVVGVGFCIHLYASWYMQGEEGYSRFFSYTNLFIFSMLILILADNLLLMYVGWEGVGLCSYLLIGFYYQDPKNGIAAIKAFITTRIGDIMLVLALLILYRFFGTLNFHSLNLLATKNSVNDISPVFWATLMLLGGAIGKSAQFPLQTWLADAMVGPTPVSALIHATTMITAGVYLITRTRELFLLVPEVLQLVGVIGSITLIMAGLSALVQKDIKRVLAYSTMSQVGYMFLAMGVQAWNAGIAHLVTHAIFKSLLFLSSGTVIMACHKEQNIFKLGGLRRSIPLVYICFIVGAVSLSAIPLITASFYSKEQILWNAVVSGHRALMLTGLIGTFITSLYIFRVIFITFHGSLKIKRLKSYSYSLNHNLPIFLLAIMTCIPVGNWIGYYLEIPSLSQYSSHHSRIMLEIFSSWIIIISILISIMLWINQSSLTQIIGYGKLRRFLSKWWLDCWGLNWIYDKIFVRTYLSVSNIIRLDPVNLVMQSCIFLVILTSRALKFSVNGKLRWYAQSLGIGLVAEMMIFNFF